MSNETLELILRLRDEATAKLANVRRAVGVVAAGIGAAGFKAGADWDDALKTITEGTGAVGTQLDGLLEDFQGIARYGPNASAAIADLNTHLGLTGPELQRVSIGALKAKIDTNAFGTIASQTGRDVDGYVRLLDQLTAASQTTGASSEQLMNSIGRNSARWIAAGGDMEGLIATVVKAADEFGPTGLRGAMSEIMEEADKGLLPAITDLNTLLGDTTGTVEDTYEAGRTLRDVLKENTAAFLAQIGPMGDTIGGVGSLTAGLLLAWPQIAAVTAGMNLMKIALIGTGIGAIVVAIGLLVAGYIKWKDEINAFLRLAWNLFVGQLERAMPIISRLAGLIGIDLPDNLDALKFSTEAATGATEDAAAAMEDEQTALENVIPPLGSAAAGLALVNDNAMLVAPSLGAARVKTDALAAAALAAAAKLKIYDDWLVNVGIDLRLVERDSRAAAEGMAAMSDTAGIAIPIWIDTRDKLGDAADGLQLVNDKAEIVIPTMAEVALGMEDAGKKAADGWADSFFPTLRRAFEGGGGFMGAVKSSIVGGFSELFAEDGALAPVGKAWGSAMSALGGIPVVGPFLTAFGPAILSGVVALGKKAFNALKGVFGGVSDKEQEGRAAADAYRQGLLDNLNPEQLAEVAGAVANGLSETGAAMHIAIRDASIAAGSTVAEAEQHATDMVHNLWLAEKGGAESVGNVVAVINERLPGLAATAAEATEDMGASFDTFFQGVTAKQAPKLTQTMIDMFKKGKDAGSSFAAVMEKVFEKVGADAGGMAGRVNAAMDSISRSTGGGISSGLGRGTSGLPAGGGGNAGATAQEIGEALGRVINKQVPVLVVDEVTDAVIGASPRRLDLIGA